MNNIAGALYRVIKIKNEMKCSRRIVSVKSNEQSTKQSRLQMVCVKMSAVTFFLDKAH